jgi:hypothetical protein
MSEHFSSPCRCYYSNAPYSFVVLSRKLCYLKRRAATSGHHLVCLMTGLQPLLKESIDRQRLMFLLFIYSIPSSLMPYSSSLRLLPRLSVTSNLSIHLSFSRLWVTLKKYLNSLCHKPKDSTRLFCISNLLLYLGAYSKR